MAEKNIIWESAGKAGLVLGGVSILYLLLTMLTGKWAEASGPVALVAILNFALWAVKFWACLYLMRLFMQRFAQADPEADTSRVFRFGMITALLSALLYSAFYLAYTSFIAPDTFDAAMETLRDNPFLDDNSLSQMEEMIPRMPTIAFFANLIYCWLFGTVLAAIYSPRIVPQNPFTDNQ
ncbi:MAG: DUF4199 domain-containing protein [Bacteroidales bacterium]|nr:DUF4199 domain-containing protein [Bacteroidales bacterium]MBR3653004.1 DUF4199 domain-containing protein [Bacteroidales bacterium]MBR3653732.1 DUF4199 domain-containing protein [Bacteroidales bacterium]